MKGLSGRVSANVVVVVALSVLLVVGAFLTYASGVVFDDSYPVQVAFPEAGGVLPDQQVTVMGRAVGQVSDVEVTEEGVLLSLSIQGDQRVPAVADATVLRRSPIGEQAVDLAPTEDDWAPAEAGDTIETTRTQVAPEVAGLLDETVELFTALEVDDVTTVVEEVALALDGRGSRLRRLGRDSLDLQRTLVDGIPEFERLLDASEATLAVLQEQRDTLRSAIANGADLTEVFAENRGNLEGLLDDAPVALDQAETLLVNTRSNFGCLMLDLTAVNRMLLGPSTYEGENGPDLYSSKLDELERGLIRQNFFFANGFSLVAQPDSETGLLWLRVLLAADSPQTAEFYPELRPTPQTTPGAACVSDEFGRGTDAVRQDGVQEPHETAPGIDYAPLVEATSERAEPRFDGSESSRQERRVDGSVESSRTSASGGSAGSGTSEDAPVEIAAEPGSGDDLASTGYDTATLVAIGVALIALPAMGWLAVRLRRHGSRS